MGTPVAIGGDLDRTQAELSTSVGLDVPRLSSPGCRSSSPPAHRRRIRRPLVAGAFVTIFLRAAISPERKTGSIGWIRAITGPNAKIFFGILFLGWVAASGILIPSFPNTANSPYGAIALIAMFTGFFIMMGLLWAVIGE